MDNIDDAEYDDLDPEARRLVEAKLNRRDRELAKRGGLQRPPAFLDSEDDAEFTLPTRRRRHYDSEPAYSMDGSEDMMDEEISAEALGDVKYRLPRNLFLMIERQQCKIGFCIPQSAVQSLENSERSCLNILMKSENLSTVRASIILASAISKV